MVICVSNRHVPCFWSGVCENIFLVQTQRHHQAVIINSKYATRKKNFYYSNKCTTFLLGRKGE